MSEKIFTRLLRLYPSSFRKKYEGEALQLIRDRLRDERGFFKRARLWWDLLADVLTALPSAYRNSYAVTEAAPLSLNPAGIPSFKILEEEPLGLGSSSGRQHAIADRARCLCMVANPVDRTPSTREFEWTDVSYSNPSCSV